MMRFLRYLALLMLSLAVLPCAAQGSKTDSLLSLLPGAGQSEKVKINIELADLATKHEDRIKYSQEALRLSILADKSNLIVDSYIKLADIYRSNREYAMSENQYREALKIAESKADLENQARLLNHMSTLIYEQDVQDRYDNAIQFAERALQISVQNNFISEEATAYQNLGNVNNRQNKFDDALNFYLKALEIRRKDPDKERLVNSLNTLGNFYYSKGDFNNAILYHKENYEVRKEIGDSYGTGIALNNLGNASLQLGNYEAAINYYKEASEIFKAQNFQPGIAATLTGMAVIYEMLQQKDAALRTHKEILQIRLAQNNPRELANTYNNLGIIYMNLLSDSLESVYGRDYRDTLVSRNLKVNIAYGKEAIDNNRKALEIRREINDLRGIGTSLANLGVSYFYIGDLEKARQTFEEWTTLSEQIDDVDQKVSIYIALGMIYKSNNQLAEALNILNTAMDLAQKVGKSSHFMTISENLAEVYEKLGNYRKAYDYHRIFAAYKDSLVSEESRKIVHEMQIKYETEAKERENELLRKDQMLNETKLRNSRRALAAAVIVVLVFVGLVIQLIRQNNFRRKANEELARKNALITEQKKEITDSIMYASRIQTAMLPPDEIITELIPQQFVMYRPRDIVSGDFYWLTEKNNRVVVMIADCTGHGVPGAFMSMLGVAYLNEIITKNENFTADLILNELRKQVIKSLHQTGREGESQDGMDVALFIIDRNNLQLEFAGANNPLFVFRNEEFVELKPDKMPIGIHTNIHQPFTPKSFQLMKGDMLYAFSDGYPDQFGGEQNKKFMIRNFRNLLQSIHKKAMQEQKRILEETLDTWMSNTHQIDDILVMGVRV